MGNRLTAPGRDRRAAPQNRNSSQGGAPGCFFHTHFAPERRKNRLAGQAIEKDFCKQTGLDRDGFRSQVEGFGRSEASRATAQAKKQLEKEKQDAIIKEEIRKAGGFSEKAKIHLSPRQIDTDTLGFDEQHINKERKHNVTREEAVLWIRNAKISVTVWNGQYERYYGYDGTVYVNVQGYYIRTAYGKNEFQKEVLRILEVLKKYGY